jgi:DNA-binding response OmpR family regulator
MAIGRVLLVAEDDPLREMLAAIVEAEGYDVHATVDLLDAATLLPAFTPDVLLVDLSHPGLLKSEIFRSRQKLRVPLMIISSLPEGPTLAKLLGADAFVPIPILVPDLLATLHLLSEGGVQTSRFLVIHGGVERRSGPRPRVGDVKPCPRCGHAMRFEDAWTASPAWVCRNEECLKTEFVRVQSR